MSKKYQPIFNKLNSVFPHGDLIGNVFKCEEYDMSLQTYIKEKYTQASTRYKFDLYFIIYTVLFELKKHKSLKANYNCFNSVKINKRNGRIFLYDNTKFIKVTSIINYFTSDIMKYCRTHDEDFLEKIINYDLGRFLDIIELELERLQILIDADRPIINMPKNQAIKVYHLSRKKYEIGHLLKKGTIATSILPDQDQDPEKGYIYELSPDYFTEGSKNEYIATIDVPILGIYNSQN
jgi:hypothetical protein